MSSTIQNPSHQDGHDSNGIQSSTTKKTYQSVEGNKVYKTRKYVQSEETKRNAENRRLRDQYLVEHKDEIMKIEHRMRNKEVQKMIKQDLKLDFNYNTLYSALKKYELL